jgi:hypothetical protein
MNIDNIKLQLYVDGELDSKDISEVEKFIQNNPSAKKKVDEYRQINNLLFEKYKSIEQENIPQRTIDLFIKEKKSIFQKFFNYEIKLINALAAACVVLIVFTVTNYNFDNKNLYNLNVKSKTSILNELSNIIGEENISTVTSNINQLNINYKTKREFKNNVNENCKEIQFFDFKLNDINIDEAVFCEDKLIKLKFYKGDLKPI